MSAPVILVYNYEDLERQFGPLKCREDAEFIEFYIERGPIRLPD